MLILTRKLDESIVINENIKISIVEIIGDSVKLGIDAPKSVKIYRSEVLEAIKRENEQAKFTPAILPQLPKLQDKI